MARRSRAVVPRINWGDPEAEGLLSCIVAIPGGMMDILRGHIGTRAGTADPTRSNEYGTLDAYFDGASDQYEIATGEIADSGNPFTVVWESNLAAFSPDRYPMVCHWANAASTQPVRVFYSDDVSYGDITIGHQTGTALKAAIPSGISVTGQRHWGAWSYYGGTFTNTANHAIWINGQLCSLSSGAGLASVTESTRIGGSSSGVTDWNGVIRQARLYERAWTEGDARRFWSPDSRDSLFSPPRRRIYLGVTSGGTTYTITPSGGITLSGSSTISRDRTIAVSGGITMGGTASDYETHNSTMIITPSGGITMGGDAPITFGNTAEYIITPSGGIILSGSAAISRDRVVAVSGGITLGGTASDYIGHNVENIITPSGGIFLSGSSSMIFTSGDFVSIKGGMLMMQMAHRRRQYRNKIGKYE